MKDLVESGYRDALSLAKSHYENFPVVSLLIPAKFRKDIAIIYWFARTADDYADEGNYDASLRLEKLQAFKDRLCSLLNDETVTGFEAALRNTIVTRKLNSEYFFNLLNAFKQDIIKTRYKDIDEVLDYCSNSANPVGRILLELFDVRNEKAFYYSDRICTALQLTNFIQDTKIDFIKGRIYYPIDEMENNGVDEKMFEMKEISDNLKKLIELSVTRTQSMFDEGKSLLEFLSGRFRYEIAWTIKGGEEILDKIRGADFDVFTKRPVLTKKDYLKLLFNSFISK
ncbi:MAG: squalene synthase HpnC [Ignavibacteriaceae bacterium]|jgi:squalene synthase HpnC|nr:squalene synthase HpnC [Ignavibacteriaceae bacterium]